MSIFSAWLDRHGFSKYAELFADNDIDLDVVQELTDEDLEKLGVSLGDRRRFLKAAASLDVSTLSEPSEMPGGETREAERRQLTVMFVDLVGSTELSAKFDPEDMREVIRGYQETCAESVSRYDGHLAKYIGDGILVYFGYPQAHEDDPIRAVHTGLELIAGMTRLNARLQRERDIRLDVRVGIHVGLVVAGEMGSGETREKLAVVGETPNIASRLEGIAEPNTVVISAATYRLIEGFFECEALGFRNLKGVSDAMDVYRVLSKSGAQSRFDFVPTTRLTPLVGREEDVRLLLDRWEHVKEGHGHVVLLSGEAGIGKSRLVQIVKERLASESHALMECRCSTYHQNSVLYPVIDLLERWLRFTQEDSAEEKLRKLEGALEDYSFSLPEAVPLLATLLSVPLDDRHQPLNLSPQQQRKKTLELLLEMLVEEPSQQPALFIVEDLHWVDPTTLELLNLIVDQARKARILTLFTFRPAFTPPWATRSYATGLVLNHFTRRQGEIMIGWVAGGKELPDEVLQQLVTNSDGVPLFLEELTKMVLESSLLREVDDRYELTAPLPPLAIPATLQDSLTARLDRLGTSREVTQLGATIGREFSYELLEAVCSLDERRLQQELDHLVRAELLYQSGAPPKTSYIFKHALIQEAAYQSLLRSRRQQYHQKIARVLEDRYPATVETHPELLAYHYAEASLSEQAISYLQRAGQRATERSAHSEAVSHLNKGLELLAALPATPEHTQWELALQTALGPALMAAKGYAALEVEHTYARARELCQQVGETPQLFPVLRGLWMFYLVRAEHETARELAEQLLDLAGRTQDSVWLVEGHYTLGMSLFWLGEFSSARKHTVQSLRLYDSRQHHTHTAQTGQDPGVICLSRMALIVSYLGFPDQARERIDETFVLAQELSHPFSLAYALVFTAISHHIRAEIQLTQERAESAIALSTEQGFPHWLAGGNIMRGWALAEQGQGEEGIALMREGLTSWRAGFAELLTPYYLALLAEAYGKVGRSEEGIHLLAEALAQAHKTKERFHEAELHRLKGELLLRHACPDEYQAETCFRHALDIARRQQAKLLELRSVMSLSRLWSKQDKKKEAVKLLGEVYDWFTEGFDTADLKEAKALLEELS